MKHRKLFPSLTEANSTADCPFCDPSSCPSNCYPYSYYYQPPLPLPPSPSPHFGFQVSVYVIIVVGLLAIFFLILSYCAISKSWIGSRTNTHPRSIESSSDEEFLDETRVDHPIWYITTSGLQQSIINSIAVCRYKKGEGLIEGTECSVCLSEFQQDETLRMLPKCNHAFHISCIDTWLRSHTNCPLCRACIVRDGISSPADSQNLQNADFVVSTQTENSQNGVSGNQRETNEIPLDGDEREHKNEAISTRNEDTRLRCNPDHLAPNDHLQPMRESFSLDSSTPATIRLDEVDHSPSESEGSTINQAECSKNTDSSRAQFLQETPVAIQRSLYNPVVAGFSLEDKAKVSILSFP